MRAEPGNKAIATLVLEGLAVRGEHARAERGRAALAEPGQDLSTAPRWLAEGSIRALFGAVELEPARARALGHRLLAAEATGLFLYRNGLGTPEKAYRRAARWLPRDDAASAWSVHQIGEQAARIEYRPAKITGAARTEAALCSLRRGMLESIPGLYGLLPARIDEFACVQNGAEACDYGVTWERSSVLGSRAGALVGVLAAAWLVAVVADPPSPPGFTTVLAAVGLFLAAVLAGRVFDLKRQLAAVAGARRGHLALFDQVDDALAEKLDTLARVGARLETARPEGPLLWETGEIDDAHREEALTDQTVGAFARKIHGSAGDLEVWIEDQRARGNAIEGLYEERSRVRKIREWAARIGRFRVGLRPGWRERVDPGALIRRAIAASRPLLPPGARVRLEVAPSLPTLVCDPVQIEHLVVALLRNAIEASVDLNDAPEAIVSLGVCATGIELCIEDRGVGIESNAIDEAFDPFFEDAASGEDDPDEDPGLKTCLGIVEGHDGELRFDNGLGAGTRVTVLLPTETREPSVAGTRRIEEESG